MSQQSTTSASDAATQDEATRARLWVVLTISICWLLVASMEWRLLWWPLNRQINAVTIRTDAIVSEFTGRLQSALDKILPALDEQERKAVKSLEAHGDNLMGKVEAMLSDVEDQARDASESLVSAKHSLGRATEAMRRYQASMPASAGGHHAEQ